MRKYCGELLVRAGEGKGKSCFFLMQCASWSAHLEFVCMHTFFFFLYTDSPLPPLKEKFTMLIESMQQSFCQGIYTCKKSIGKPLGSHAVLQRSAGALQQRPHQAGPPLLRDAWEPGASGCPADSHSFPSASTAGSPSSRCPPSSTRGGHGGSAARAPRRSG